MEYIARMPAQGASKKSHRDCLVCGAPARSTNFGVDVCRNCSVFYRRCISKPEQYVCRAGTGGCAAGAELKCRKCRLIHLERILKQSGAKDKMLKAPLRDGVCADSQIKNHPTMRRANQTATPLLSSVRIAYEKMSFARLSGELNNRKDPPSPIQININHHPIYPATYATANHSNRVFLTCILDLGETCFPEFCLLTDDEKWSIAVDFYFVFRMFEGIFRARKQFSHISNRWFYGYTLWLSEEVAGSFFDDCEEKSGDFEEAKRITVDTCRSKFEKMRALMDKVNPDDEEFLALLVLMFWSPNRTSATEQNMNISEIYRNKAFEELNTYYKDVVGLKECASRLGELYMFLSIFEHNEDIKENYEVFRLLGVFPKECFTYTVSKE